MIETNFRIEIIISRLVKFSSIFETDCSSMITFDFYILNLKMDNKPDSTSYYGFEDYLKGISAEDTTLKLLETVTRD